MSLKNGTNEESSKFSNIGVQVNFDSYPVAFYKNRPIDKELIVKLRREEFKVDPQCIRKDEPIASQNNTNENNENASFKEVKKKLPWYAGCEYVCRECDELYFYSEELRKHIKEKHGDPDEYLDKHDKFETKAVVMPCLECNKNIKRHFNSILMHLRNHHQGMTMEEYRKKFKVPVKYEVVVKLYDKTLKEPKEIMGRRSTGDDSSKLGIKRRSTTEPNLPSKVTRSRSHLSSSEEEKGRSEGFDDKTDVSQATSTASETDEDEDTKSKKVGPCSSVTTDEGLISNEASTEEMSRSNDISIPSVNLELPVNYNVRLKRKDKNEFSLRFRYI